MEDYCKVSWCYIWVRTDYSGYIPRCNLYEEAWRFMLLRKSSIVTSRTITRVVSFSKRVPYSREEAGVHRSAPTARSITSLLDHASFTVIFFDCAHLTASMIDLQFFASTLLVRITRGYLTESLLHLLYEGVVFHAKPFLLAKISRKLFRARSVATLCTWRCTTANHYRWVPLIVRTTILKQRLSRRSGVKMKYVTTCRSRLRLF